MDVINGNTIRYGWVLMIDNIIYDIRSKNIQGDYQSRILTECHIRSIEDCLLHCLENKKGSFFYPLYSPVSNRGGSFGDLIEVLEEIKDKFQSDNFNGDALGFSEYIKSTLRKVARKCMRLRITDMNLPV